jgi:hypothetical protein
VRKIQTQIKAKRPPILLNDLGCIMKRKFQALDTRLTSIDIRYLNLDFSGFGDYDFLTLKRDGKEFQIGIARTALNYGGHRHWLQCDYCGRRVVELFITQKPQIACRHCIRAKYESLSESTLHKSARAARTVRAKFGWQQDFSFCVSQRPRGMHAKTFNRLLTRHSTKSAPVIARFKWAGWL